MARGDLTPQEIELRKTISNNINSLLNIKNKKQIDVHNATKIPKSTLTGYVKGTSIPVAGNVQKIADFFGVKNQILIQDIVILTISRKNNHLPKQS